MKNSIVILFLSFVFSVNAQQFSGKAIYKTSRKTNFKIGEDSKMSDQQKEQLEARMRK